MVSPLSGQPPRFENLDDAIAWGLERTRPSPDFSRQLVSYSHYLCALTKEFAENADFPIRDVILAGSVSRQTFLPWSVDIDLFARLDVTSKAELANFAFSVLPKVAEREKTEIEFRFAENPYGHFSTKVMEREVGVDIVATAHASQENLRSVLKISGMARTPFHNDFLDLHIKGLKDQVRLLKWWFVRKKVYGQFGFTGFLTEYLTGYFKGFSNVLKAADEITRSRIDFHQRHTLELEKSFPGDKVIIVDPVDEKRNAAAGIHGIVGYFKLQRFVRESLRSITDPTTMFDEIRPTNSYQAIRASFNPPPHSPDEEGSRYARVASLLQSALKEEGIEITDLILAENPVRLFFEPDRSVLSMRTVKGPPKDLELAVSKFKEHHKHVFSKNGRLYAHKPPRFETFNDLVLNTLRNQPWIVSPTIEHQKGNPSSEKEAIQY